MSSSHNDPHGQATFRGQAQDHDGRPIEGFVRVFHGDSPYVSRKITGSFLLQLPPGHYRIEVHAEGYQPVQINLVLHKQQGAAHQFVMNKIWHSGGGEPPAVTVETAVRATGPEPESAPDTTDAAITAPANGDLSVEEMLYADDEKQSD